MTRVAFHIFDVPASDGRTLEDLQEFTSADLALGAIEASTADLVVLASGARLQAHAVTAWEDYLDNDVSHAGLAAGSRDALTLLWHASTSWHYLNPQPRQRAYSWKADLELCLIRPSAVRAVGGFDAAYEEPTGRLIDLCFRIQLAGGRVFHEPKLAAINTGPGPTRLPSPHDEYVFALRHLGTLQTVYAAAWQSVCKGAVSPELVLRARERVRTVPKPRAQPSAAQQLRLLGQTRRQRIGEYTVVIPTINRPHFVPRAIDSLLSQDPAPKEIVVVDQTPVAARQPVYSKYDPDRVRVIYLDRAGQCLARNRGVREATCDWVLLFDDDGEAQPGLAAAHINTLEHTGADASTGGSLAPWKTLAQLPSEFDRVRAANVLDTGNCMIRRASLFAVGGLDSAFDRGSGADNDLGSRMLLTGCQIVTAPGAVRTHFKATAGGLRTHSAWWRGRTTPLGPFPPPTELYWLRQRYPSSYHASQYLLCFLKARRYNGKLELAWLWMTAPLKLAYSLRRSRSLTYSPGLPGPSQAE